MVRLHRAAVILMGLMISAFAQTASPGWLSFQRLSVNVQSGYFFNPWNDYNRAVETVGEQIRYDRRFFEPQGFYEQIRGDVCFQGGINYALSERLQIVVTGQLGGTGAGFEFYPDPEKIPDDQPFFGETAFRQTLDFDLRSLGVGIAYRLPLSSWLALTAQGGIDFYHGELQLHWQYARGGARGPLEAGEGEVMKATLSENRRGWHAALGMRWKLLGPLILTAGLDYRSVKFPDLQGKGFYQADYPGPDNSTEFTAELVKERNYFGVRAREEGQPDFYFYLPELTFNTEPFIGERTPATLDFSAIGIRTGISIGF
ncbi:MAG: hypothetical protein KDH97_15170 [Calditrichaeota bacterium]|nr:hypothetical protein [Calditrichota bacterium]MCB0297998.1 hypothetical protein [Calditrichota bacterium]MCB0304894.1 hypothetical protein [Calditrichota bacterium]